MESLINKYHADWQSDQSNGCVKRGGDARCVSCCREQYFSGSSIDYSCTQARRMYVMRYLPVHVMEIYLAAMHIPSGFWDRVRAKKKLSILAIGGGPGTDVVAIKRCIRYKLDDEDHWTVTVCRCDLEQGWDSVAPDLHYLESDPRVDYSYKQIQRDISSGVWAEGRRYDVISVSYLVSEFAGGMMTSLINTLDYKLRPGGALLVNDRAEEDVIQRIRYLCTQLGVSVVHEDDSRVNCGVDYTNAVKDAVSPKLMTNSRRFTSMRCT